MQNGLRTAAEATETIHDLKLRGFNMLRMSLVHQPHRDFTFG